MQYNYFVCTKKKRSYVADNQYLSTSITVAIISSFNSSKEAALLLQHEKPTILAVLKYYTFKCISLHTAKIFATDFLLS